jgi:hypothetical protein
MAEISGFLVRGRDNKYGISLTCTDTNIHCTSRKSILTLQRLVAIPDVASSFTEYNSRVVLRETVKWASVVQCIMYCICLYCSLINMLQWFLYFCQLYQTAISVMPRHSGTRWKTALVHTSSQTVSQTALWRQPRRSAKLIFDVRPARVLTPVLPPVQEI